LSLSMYQASIPPFVQMLNNLSAIMDKAEAHAANRKIDPDVLFNYRLAPDMFPFVRQLQVAADLAKGAAARLAGVEVPKHDTEKTFGELKARLDSALDWSFSDDPFSDLAFDLGNPTINIYAGKVLLTALGWTTYDTYLAEMKELLS